MFINNKLFNNFFILKFFSVNKSEGRERYLKLCQILNLENYKETLIKDITYVYHPSKILWPQLIKPKRII